ncbi:hypothetical protein BC829DRAFT_394034 [Chytridium lagenaria]|nr:hypothetical protein BC829DRAFT_394034 [Chytridium lagenaria]
MEPSTPPPSASTSIPVTPNPATTAEGSTSITPRSDATNSAAQLLDGILHTIPIAALLAHRKIRFAGEGGDRKTLGDSVVAVEESTEVGTVMCIMARYRIVAVPVFRKRESGKEEYLGIVSIQDVLAWTVFQRVFDKIELENTQHAFSRWLEVDAEVKSFFQTPVSSLLGLTRESNMTCGAAGGTWMLRASDSITTLLRMLTIFHRVLVVGEDGVKGAEAGGELGEVRKGEKVTLVTQTDLLRWIVDYRDSFAAVPMAVLLSSRIPEVLQHRLHLHPSSKTPFDATADPIFPKSKEQQTSTTHGEMLTLASRRRHIIAVPSTWSALQCFRVMHLHRLSAVPIMDTSASATSLVAREQVVANLSAESLASLLLPVKTFLRRVREFRKKEQIVIEDEGEVEVAEVSWEVLERVRMFGEDETLWIAILTALKSGIHRIWVQDAKTVKEAEAQELETPPGKPVDVVTMTDMLSFFLPRMRFRG